jgi:hypothetical protein
MARVTPRYNWAYPYPYPQKPVPVTAGTGRVHVYRRVFNGMVGTMIFVQHVHITCQITLITVVCIMMRKRKFCTCGWQELVTCPWDHMDQRSPLTKLVIYKFYAAVRSLNCGNISTNVCSIFSRAWTSRFSHTILCATYISCSCIKI